MPPSKAWSSFRRRGPGAAPRRKGRPRPAARRGSQRRRPPRRTAGIATPHKARRARGNLLLHFPRPEAVLVGVHVHALAAEADTFHFEMRALFQGGFAMELDGAAGSQHALPGERSHRRSAQQLRHLAVIERVARGGGDLPISGDLAARDLADRSAESGIAARIPGSAQQFSRGLARGYGPMGTADHGWTKW